MNGIKNDAELKSFVLNMIAKEVVSTVSVTILDKLRDNIAKYVYMNQEPSYYYRGSMIPTGQFYNAFKWEKMRTLVYSVVDELYYDWKSMDYDGSSGSYLHGNEYSRFGDVREELADWFNRSPTTGSKHPFLWKKTNRYWDKAMDELFNRRRIDIEIGKVNRVLSRKLGLKIKKIG